MYFNDIHHYKGHLIVTTTPVTNLHQIYFNYKHTQEELEINVWEYS